MIDPQLLEILVCPETKESVEMAPDELVTEINQAILAGKVVNRGGKKVAEQIDSGLLREDKRCLYPIRDEIPIMLVEEAIQLPLS